MSASLLQCQFADSDTGDPSHLPACSVRDSALEQGALPVTTDYVMDQTLTLIGEVSALIEHLSLSVNRTPQRPMRCNIMVVLSQQAGGAR